MTLLAYIERELEAGRLNKLRSKDALLAVGMPVTAENRERVRRLVRAFWIQLRAYGEYGAWMHGTRR